MHTPVDENQGRDTLRYLRLMLLVIPLLLLVAIALYAWWTGSIGDSISSYYIGPARNLFVAMMVTTGVLLVVYKGPPLEDQALNLAGFYAMFVAFVPAGLGQTLGTLDPAAARELIRSIQVSVVAVLVVAVAFGWLEWKTRSWSSRSLLQRTETRWLAVAGTLLLAGFLVLLLWRTLEGKDFVGVHLAAALLLLASMGIAIASHLGSSRLGDTDTSGGRAGHYAGLLVLMALGVVAWAVLAALGVRQAVFFVEWYEIALFLYFWYLETRRTWNPVPAPETGTGRHAAA
ncbi:hypothetical protein BLJ79_10720 [Arthrobacter sp. UCD-GKA]|uniref:hypothetical protein n=1 Tax=Arthrobacter sp. UCD-GKA TaxID=1913576 RepID=UPI0008DE0C18|nr:hypothetical protein [Arthrobacter sp. UCD-GKA]OIH84599.1 hypothetical protein BLJ79_10720 [Arthrobacter sp. UCD-GKA]